MPEEWIRRNETEIDLFIPAEIISAEIFFAAIKKVKPSEYILSSYKQVLPPVYW